MGEMRRGCGYRKIGGLYLCSGLGGWVECDGLPLPLEPCQCCGFEPPFARSFQWITASYVAQAAINKHKADAAATHDTLKCTCPQDCPICYPQNTGQEKFGLMWVGQKYYTPESFVKEAMTMGVSKRIPEIPADLVFGKTWVFAAHLKVPDRKVEANGNGNGLVKKEPKTMRAIFYGFKPDRVEMPLWKGSISEEMILKLEKRGITPVFLDPSPENKKLHKEAERVGDLLKWIDKTTDLKKDQELQA